MASPKDKDPTKDPQFRKVIDHFLKSPPKPRKKKKDTDSREKREPEKPLGEPKETEPDGE